VTQKLGQVSNLDIVL